MCDTELPKRNYFISVERKSLRDQENYIDYRIEGRDFTKQLSIEQSLQLFKNELWKLLDYRRKQGKWKMHITLKVDFKSTKSEPSENAKKYSVSKKVKFLESKRQKILLMNCIYLQLTDLNIRSKI